MPYVEWSGPGRKTSDGDTMLENGDAPIFSGRPRGPDLGTRVLPLAGYSSSDHDQAHGLGARSQCGEAPSRRESAQDGRSLRRVQAPRCVTAPAYCRASQATSTPRRLLLQYQNAAAGRTRALARARGLAWAGGPRRVCHIDRALSDGMMIRATRPGRPGPTVNCLVPGSEVTETRTRDPRGGGAIRPGPGASPCRYPAAPPR